MAKELCSACDGKGWIPNPDMDASDPNSPDNLDCETCGGDGWIETDD